MTQGDSGRCVVPDSGEAAGGLVRPQRGSIRDRAASQTTVLASSIERHSSFGLSASPW